MKVAKTEEVEMPEASTNVVYFMELLKRSLAKKGGSERKPAAKRAKSARKKSRKAARAC